MQVLRAIDLANPKPEQLLHQIAKRRKNFQALFHW
jgi:hypothetical protein